MWSKVKCWFGSHKVVYDSIMNHSDVYTTWKKCLHCNYVRLLEVKVWDDAGFWRYY